MLFNYIKMLIYINILYYILMVNCKWLIIYIILYITFDTIYYI